MYDHELMASCAIVTDKEDISINGCKVATSVFRFKGLLQQQLHLNTLLPYYTASSIDN